MSGPRVVIVGAGRMGRCHADAARHAGGRVVGVCDADPAAAAALAGPVGAAADRELAPLLGRCRPDIAHVCTPLASHGEIAALLLERGLHVLVEKPLAATAAETERLLALARGRARFLRPAHQLVYQRWLAARGSIGELIDFAYVTCSAGAALASPKDPEAVVAEVLSHPLSLADRLLAPGLGEVHWQVTRPRPGELHALGRQDGVALRVSISMAGRPTRHELTLTGTGGTLHADLFHGFAWREGGHSSRAYKVARPLAGAGQRLAAAAANLARRAAAGETAYPGLRALVAAVYAEAAGGPPALGDGHVLAVARARDALLAAR